MDERFINVPLPDGTIKKGLDVFIDESNERWSELNLKDGSTLRVKFSVSQIIKVPGEYDHDGNPLYVVKGTPMVTVSHAPDELRKK